MNTYNDENIYEEIRYLTPRQQSNETNNHEQGHLAELNCEFIIQKIRKRKWWILLIIVLVLIVGLAVGLSVSSPPTMATSTTTALTPTTSPTGKAVLMLSTRTSTNVPMVITLNGK